ncbi:MAG: acyl-CoA thioesterase [Bacteroidia bacterium]|jgi:acyl-CoA hydrolase|nr:acyl-CoA thioesterase [Bacteroidia bacterium]|tara:strand:+ start:255 stop:776 length:522 start_codon:yes stop_codon:yes gene_type:complete
MTHKIKKPSDSHTVMNELVLPNDTNTLNNLMGGRLLHWMDICAAIAGQKHSNQIVVTASVDSVSFKEAIRLGDVVTLKAYVTRAFKTSMEVFIEVYAQNIPNNEKIKCNEAYYTFVALDSRHRPVPVPQIETTTKEEKEKFEGAVRRRQVRLIMAGKMKPSEAAELKMLFDTK